MLRHGLLCGAAAVAILCSAASAEAAVAYDMEGAPPPSGFGPNGGGVTVTQDTIGATQGSNSMKVSIVEGATFVGALTTNITPPIGDPPGIQSILFDLTIDTGQEFTGAFAVVGVTVFGASQPDYPGGQQFGLQAQFKDFVSVDGLAAGTYENLQIDLDAAYPHPLTGEDNLPFNEIFGTVGSGPNDLIPSGFQLYFNKSADATMTVYIDNIRTIVPEPTTGLLLGIAAIAIGLMAARRR